MYICLEFVCVHMCECVFAYVCVCVRACLCMHAFTYTHIRVKVKSNFFFIDMTNLSRVPDQNGISQACYIIYSRDTPF